MTKTKTFEAFLHENKGKKQKWVVIPQDKGESYAKHLAAGNPIQVVWTYDDGTRKEHIIKNQENMMADAA